MRLITSATALAALAAEVSRAGRFAFDLEANGRFAYKARVCSVQLAWDGGTAIVDALATPLSPLADVLGEGGPIKIIHDVAFDARMLAETGIAVGNVRDTALAASFLGRSATGLSSLAQSELGVALDKTLQAHDWARRPLDAAMLAYLEKDVLHLAALCDRLWPLVTGAARLPASAGVTLGSGADAADAGDGEPGDRAGAPAPRLDVTEGDAPGSVSIEAEVICETQYRIAQAIAGATLVDPRPGYTRIKGAEKLDAPALAVLRHLYEARDREAQRLDVPAGELVGQAAMIDLARYKPTDVDSLRRIRGAMPRHQGYAVARELVRAVKAGVADGDIPETDRAWVQRPALPMEVTKRRRAREARLLSWRKKEAKARGVNEQVVLPGHCLKDASEIEPATMEELAKVPGIGAFRVARDGPALLDALALTPEPAAR
jgi:ribonuclease D